MAAVIIEQGANRGAAFAIEREAILGRDLACAVPVFDDRASRRHCAIRAEGGGFVVADLSSRNGTELNGLPLGAAAAPIVAGDLVRIGATVLRFEPDLSLRAPDATTIGGALDASAALSAPIPCSSPEGDVRRLGAAGHLIAESAAMRSALELSRRAARSAAPVLVTGESGTGKELVARAIHAASARAREAFVPVNCAALAETLLESELFGHERGAFTGAEATRKGLFEIADRGTLFLDEVGECGASLQAKLLRALDSGEIRRVGGSLTLRSGARIVAATNRDLRAMVDDGTFREDLFFRLSVLTIPLAPLRERPEDVAALTGSILARLSSERGGRSIEVTPAARAAIERHPFPGNVRELRNALERAAILGDGRTIDLCDLPPEIRAARDAPAGLAAGALSLAALERRHIARVLEELKGNKTQAAKALGIDRKTLYAKLDAYGLGGPPAAEPRGA